MPLDFLSTAIFTSRFCCANGSFGIQIGKFQLVLALAIFFCPTLSIYFSIASVIACMIIGVNMSGVQDTHGMVSTCIEIKVFIDDHCSTCFAMSMKMR